MDTMRKIWNPVKGMTCREIEKKLFSFQFNSPRDVDKVLAGSPWHFNKDILVLKPVNANTQPSAMRFSTVPFWIRFYDLPLATRNLEVMKKLGDRVSTFMVADEDTISGFTRSVRIRVEINLERPLKTGTKIIIEGQPLWIPIKYERLPFFCYNCGKLGHIMKDCDLDEAQTDQNARKSQSRFSDGIRASPMKLGRKVVDKGREEGVRVRKNLIMMPSESHEEEETNQGKSDMSIPTTEIQELQSFFGRVEFGSVDKKTHFPNPSNPTPDPAPPKKSIFENPQLSIHCHTTIPIEQNKNTEHILHHITTTKHQIANLKPTISTPVHTPQHTLSHHLTDTVSISASSIFVTQSTYMAQGNQYAQASSEQVHVEERGSNNPLPPLSSRRVRIMKARRDERNYICQSTLVHNEKRKSSENEENEEENENESTCMKRHKLQIQEVETEHIPAAGVAVQPRRSQ